MAQFVTVTGLNVVLRNLKAAKPTLGAKVGRNLKRAGLFLQRESQKIVPVHKGPLKASAFTRNVGGTGWATDIVVGYTAKYAVYVHENLTTAHGRRFNIKHADKIASATTKAQRKIWFNRGVNQQAKFLEQPMRMKRRELMAIIHRGL